MPIIIGISFISPSSTNIDIPMAVNVETNVHIAVSNTIFAVLILSTLFLLDGDEGFGQYLSSVTRPPSNIPEGRARLVKIQ